MVTAQHNSKPRNGNRFSQRNGWEGSSGKGRGNLCGRSKKNVGTGESFGQNVAHAVTIGSAIPILLEAATRAEGRKGFLLLAQRERSEVE